MTALPDQMNLTLFVPADRPGRVAKAAAVGADAVIVDLEDAVAPEARDAARSGLADTLDGIDAPLILRINAAGTDWFDADLAAATLPLSAIMLAKAVLNAAEAGAAVQVTGAMIDAPVIARARQIIARAGQAA